MSFFETASKHLMAALWANSIDNILIEIDSIELPGLDGSARDFFICLKNAGIKEQNVRTRSAGPGRQTIQTNHSKKTRTCHSKKTSSIHSHSRFTKQIVLLSPDNSMRPSEYTGTGRRIPPLPVISRACAIFLAFGADGVSSLEFEGHQDDPVAEIK